MGFLVHLSQRDPPAFGEVFVACGASVYTATSAKAVASRRSGFVLIQPQAASHVAQQSHQHFGHLGKPLPGDH